MTIAFTCPHCGKQTSVADRFAGQTGPCSACGQSITIPTLGDGLHRQGRSGRSGSGCAGLVVVVLLFLLCAGLARSMFARKMPGMWESMRRSQCLANLQQIATAISIYETDYGSLPPAYTTDAEGNRLHSWRTLLLPYLGEQALYNALHLDEPWDSEANRVWHDTPVDVFQCPADSSGNFTDTSYVMIVGGEGVCDGSKPGKAVDVTDGTSKTILLIEMAGSGIHWMQPEDLRWEQTDFTFGKKESLSSEHQGGAYAMMCDGSVVFLQDDTSPADLRAMATRAGGESVSSPADTVEEDPRN